MTHQQYLPVRTFAYNTVLNDKSDLMKSTDLMAGYEFKTHDVFVDLLTVGTLTSVAIGDLNYASCTSFFHPNLRNCNFKWNYIKHLLSIMVEHFAFYNGYIFIILFCLLTKYLK